MFEPALHRLVERINSEHGQTMVRQLRSIYKRTASEKNVF